MLQKSFLLLFILSASVAAQELGVPTVPHVLTNGSAEIRVPGAGFPARGRRKAGDLVVHLAPQHPAFLGKEQKAMLEMAEQFLQHQLDSQCPALAAWNVVLDAHR